MASSNWTEKEDDRLRKLIDQHGAKRWSLIASLLGSKGSKQCRRRWKNFLNAELKTGGWSKEEDQILLDGHRIHGNKWTEIARMVGGRTDNAVKNRWAALCKRTGKPTRGCDSSGGSGGCAISTGTKAGRASATAVGGRQAVRRATAASSRKKWDDEQLSEEEEEEEEDEVSGSEDSDDGGRRAQQQRRWRQQQQQQHAAAAAAAAAVAARAMPPAPVALSIPPSDFSGDTGTRRSPQPSPTLASAVGVARSVLASTGVAGLFQPLQRFAASAPLSRLNPGFQAQQHGDPDGYYAGGQKSGVAHNGPQGMHDRSRAENGGGMNGHMQLVSRNPDVACVRVSPQQAQFQKWAGQTVMDLGGDEGRQPQLLGLKRHHSSLDSHQSAGMRAYAAALANGFGPSGMSRQEGACMHAQQQCHEPNGKRQAVGMREAYTDEVLLAGGDGDPCAARPRRSPRTHQPSSHAQMQAQGQAHAYGYAQAQEQAQEQAHAGGGWQRTASGSSPSDGSGGTLVRARTSPTTPLMSALAEAGRRSHSGSEPLDLPSGVQLLSSASVRGAAAGAAFAVVATSPGAAAKKPPGLSISIPFGPEADPAPNAGPVSYRLQVHLDKLTPAERCQVTEINQMDLPVQIHVSDEPPLTSCRRGVQQSILALASQVGGGPGGDDLAGGMDSPAGMDWISKLGRLLDSETQSGLSPGALLAHGLSQGPGVSSPRRTATRGILGGSPAMLRSSSTGRRQEDTAAAVAARALAAYQQQQQQQPGGKEPTPVTRVLTPNGSSLSPSAASLVSGLARGGLQDGHKQLLSRLLTGARVTEEVLTRVASPALLGRTPDMPGRMHSDWEQPGSPFKQASTSGTYQAAASRAAGALGTAAAGDAASAAAGGRFVTDLRLPDDSAQGLDSLLSPGAYMPLGDVLMTPHLPVDDLNSILDFLGTY